MQFSTPKSYGSDAGSSNMGKREYEKFYFNKKDWNSHIIYKLYKYIVYIKK